MSYFSDNSIEEEDRRNDAFKILCALRDALTIGKRGHQPVPYKKALQLIYDISPDLHKEISDLLTKTNQSEVVKYYIQKAEAHTLENPTKPFTPEEIIKRDIAEEKRLLKLGDNLHLIRKKIFELEASLDYFEPEDISENSFLNHDFNLVSRHEYFEKKLYDTAKLKDYQLSGNRVLRLRLLHPDKAERIIGSDLVYEQFNLKTELVRFMHLQYKTWNTNVLYLSQGNIADQIQKLDNNICKAGYCNSNDGTKHSKNYRFPYCSAFLRPTSYIRKPDSSLISTGIHIPICMIHKIQAEGDNQINKKNSRHKSIGHKIFEELFIENSIGSRWMTIAQLEKFYKEKGIASDTARIRVHAQEVIYQSEEEKHAGEF